MVEGRAAADGAIASNAWPLTRLGEALSLLAVQGRLVAVPKAGPPLWGENAPSEPEALDAWVNHVAAHLGVEANAVEATVADVERALAVAGPAIVRLPAGEPEAPPQFLVLLCGGQRLTLLTPDLRPHTISIGEVRNALCHQLEAPGLVAVERLLAASGVAEARRPRAARAIVQEQLDNAPVPLGWLLRISPAAGAWRQARHAGVSRTLISVLGASVMQQLLLVTTWWILGRTVLSQHFESAWIAAVGLTLLSLVSFQLLETAARNWFSIGLEGVFKQRLLFGALKLDPDDVRGQGIGQFMARVEQSGVIEEPGLASFLVVLVTIPQLLLAAGVIGMGSGNAVLLGMLGVWVLASLLVVWRLYVAESEVLVHYVEMSNTLVERMVGHTTRLIQADPERWHVDEDEELARYLTLSERRDRMKVLLAAVPASWLLAGLVGVGVRFVAEPPTGTLLAFEIGGVLLAQQALAALTRGVGSLIGAALAWRFVEPLFKAAARPDQPGVLPGLSADQAEPGQPLLLATGIDYRYRDKGRLVLNNCDLRIHHGDRILVEGPSGSGKSTLAAVLAGLRPPEAGLLLLRGYDRHTVGPELWRCLVVVAPQFHENHVFTGTLSFNLLLGRRWPPTPDDLAEADAVCRDLGLGDLIDRMPSGFQQMVGESGWQLSHGEQSRLFIARALLQRADLVILDESFGALDPENLRLALRCAIDRARTLFVIAHP